MTHTRTRLEPHHPQTSDTLPVRRLVCVAPETVDWVVDTIPAAPQDDQVRIRSEWTALKHGTELFGICGIGPFSQSFFDLDLRLFVDRPDSERDRDFPRRIGNMTVGVVEEVGPQVRYLRPGQQVFGYLPAATHHLCHSDQVQPLQGLTWQQAVCVDPAMFALGAVADGGVGEGQRVLVTGLGAIGLLVVQECKRRGATVHVSSSFRHRRQLAEAFGADFCHNTRELDDIGLAIKQADARNGRRGESCGVDVAIECSGKYYNLRHAVRSARQCGRVVLLGFYDGGAEALCLGEEVFHNRLTLLASLPAFRWKNPVRGNPPIQAQQLQELAVDSLRSGRWEVDRIVNRVHAEDAVETVHGLIETPKDLVKIVIEY